MTSKTQAAIDRAVELTQDSEFRSHLGASIIGRECAREVWYVFRWAFKVKHEARKLRIFDRGKRYEREVFITWLRAAGIEVVEADPATGEQFRISWASGHAGGSLDARLFNVPDLIGHWLLGEFKTHNENNFKRLKKEGVAGAFWTHYVQTQIYMGHNGLPAALYFGLNKNDDELYVELVLYNPEIAAEYTHRAERVIAAETPPPRISESPAWYKCRMCDFVNVCHRSVPMARNCRTCVHSQPTENATWTCRRYNYVLSKEEQLRGCTDYLPIVQ